MTTPNRPTACAVCGAAITQDPAHRIRRYCGGTCRSRASREARARREEAQRRALALALGVDR